MIAATRVPAPAEDGPKDGGAKHESDLRVRGAAGRVRRGARLMWRRATQRGERAEPFGLRVLTNGARIEALRHVRGWESKLQILNGAR